MLREARKILTNGWVDMERGRKKKKCNRKKTAGLSVLFKGLDFSSSGFPLGLRTRWVQCAASAKTVQ